MQTTIIYNKITKSVEREKYDPTHIWYLYSITPFTFIYSTECGVSPEGIFNLVYK